MTETIEFNPVPLIANELNTPATDVNAVVKLLSEGNTVPFIARYRKEMTGSMDEVQIRLIEERNVYLQDLEKRRRAVLDSIEEQGKLTDALRGKILACTTKSALEDLYLPYKPKRRTRATIAKEKRLDPLALRILEQPMNGNATSEAHAFVDAEKGDLPHEARAHIARRHDEREPRSLLDVREYPFVVRPEEPAICLDRDTFGRPLGHAHDVRVRGDLGEQVREPRDIGVGEPPENRVDQRRVLDERELGLRPLVNHPSVAYLHKLRQPNELAVRPGFAAASDDY